MAERKLLLDRDQFPSNTYEDQLKRGQEAEKRKKVEKVTKGKVVKERKSLGKRIKGTFIQEDASAIGGYIWDDVVAPAIRNTIFAVAMGSLSMALFGTIRNGTPRDPLGQQGSVFRYDLVGKREDRALRNRDTYAKLYFDDKYEADRVLEMMREIVDEYGSVCVADMYELAGTEVDPIDYKWGWTGLKRASVVYDRDGYTIDLPPTKPV